MESATSPKKERRSGWSCWFCTLPSSPMIRSLVSSNVEKFCLTPLVLPFCVRLLFPRSDALLPLKSKLEPVAPAELPCLKSSILICSYLTSGFLGFLPLLHRPPLRGILSARSFSS